MDWTAIWTGTAAATVVLVCTGTWQIFAIIFAIRKENKKQRTLAVCARYEANAVCARYEANIVVGRCVRELRQAEDADFKKDPRKFKHEVIIVLNYLDQVATGIDQKVYDGDMIRDHMAPIFAHYRKMYLSNELMSTLGKDIDDYKCLCRMTDQWKEPELRYR
jgi:hypothetical protein